MKKLILEKFKNSILKNGDALKATIGGGYPCAQGSCVGVATQCVPASCSGGTGTVALNRKDINGITLPSCNTYGGCN